MAKKPRTTASSKPTNPHEARRSAFSIDRAYAMEIARGVDILGHEANAAGAFPAGRKLHQIACEVRQLTDEVIRQAGGLTLSALVDAAGSQPAKKKPVGDASRRRA